MTFFKAYSALAVHSNERLLGKKNLIHAEICLFVLKNCSVGNNGVCFAVFEGRDLVFMSISYQFGARSAIIFSTKSFRDSNSLLATFVYVHIEFPFLHGS